MATLRCAGKPAHLWERSGRTFQPKLHFTGLQSDRAEVRRVQALLDKYAPYIVAHAAEGQPKVTCFPGCFTIELQFSDEEKQWECLEEYQDGCEEQGDEGDD